jgi:hypothetical protein
MYSEKWEKFSDELRKILDDDSREFKPTNPLLIYLDEEKYQSSDIKIMIFGQETNDWGDNFTGDPNDALNTYNDFFNSNACYGYAGHFWNGVNRFLTLLSQRFPDKNIASVWNNVIKVGNSGRNKNNPPEYIYNIEKTYFNVIENEIEILKPNIILFVSGPYYDTEIQNSLTDVSFSKLNNNFSDRAIAKLKYKNLDNVYRTYHPNYLWRKGINSYFAEIINDINLKS